ncbi:MAG: transglycosylase [Acidobacteria bacterium 13_1_40CM_2_64_6]|nr:MAG: transglycosylase [Acidobacteria bacterium 13_1_40CM_2_64_6]
MMVLGWMVFGLIVGVIAKVLMPGRDPGGFLVTMAIGIAGALTGGFIGRALGWYGPNDGAGFFMSLVGAILLLWLYRVVFVRRSV